MKFVTFPIVTAVKNRTAKPTTTFNCIPTTNIFICGAALAKIPRTVFVISIAVNIGKIILKAIIKYLNDMESDMVIRECKIGIWKYI